MNALALNVFDDIDIYCRKNFKILKG
jgi:hypothetical protein